MKKLMMSALVAMMVLGPVSLSFAGDRDWATAGKILAGVVGFQVLTDSFASRPYYGPSYTSYNYYAPAPVYRHHRPHHSYGYGYARPVSSSYYYEEYSAPVGYYEERRVRRCYY